MANLVQSIKSFFSKQAPLEKGFSTYQGKLDDETHYRLHLRIEPGGEGVLIVNASTVLHLNQSATEMVNCMMKDMDFNDAIKYLGKRYKVGRQELEVDYTALREKINSLVGTTDLDPVSYLGMERQMVGEKIHAPYRLDCAITYQVYGNGNAGLAPQERVSRKLSTEEWKAIIQKAYEAGIPHIIFTGGEPTLRDDLAELLMHCEKLGLVTGLLSDGVRLADRKYLVSLLEAGLDHLMLIFENEQETSWNTLRMILAEDIFTTVHLTLKPGVDLKPDIERLADMKVNAISLSTSQPHMEEQLHELRNLVAVRQIELVWDLPVPYSQFNPIALELEKDEIAASDVYTDLYVEPDGDVLPAQGINRVMGNMLSDKWDKIWSARLETAA